jgi:glutaredoxin
MMTTTTTLYATCPHCHAQHDAATALKNGRKPKPGDLTFCFDCGEWSALDDTLVQRPCNDIELDYIGTNPDSRRLRELWVKRPNTARA